jgi:hypothetical protein
MVGLKAASLGGSCILASCTPAEDTDRVAPSLLIVPDSRASNAAGNCMEGQDTAKSVDLDF